MKNTFKSTTLRTKIKVYECIIDWRLEAHKWMNRMQNKCICKTEKLLIKKGELIESCKLIIQELEP